MKPNLIITSHGNLASEILNSANMIVGDTSSIKTVCMAAEDGLEGTTKKMQEAIASCNHESIVILADLYGGTPFNVAVINAQKNDNIRVVSGLNLGMVIEYSVSQLEDVHALADYLCEVGKNGVIAPAFDADEDDCDIE
ncbi:MULTISPECIES: PTS sugar transporter subunit IIA [Bacillota]|jgi:PTS system mannose-specific IIA component|uniref:PTS sugar transporter subunit IIABC n=2 Tax=Amedibacillus TaxID=2749846 RepID=A0A7G9GP58_9FIRM|nr:MULTISPECIES: PTS sugar transporter subunit IIA [Bacillota]QNM12590.1 PTS sugar transporter subunit IIABC [[Eubacterium] hominis]MCH4284101.1 hypothetical protein [Amedibacillus hominis]RGB57644.1 PTS sugar transporter subunit IIABC [Absiella sp. AM22-9]RGB62250.1 PTS sugar transporter subunit IIABC [Absiella sp. AM10-20]RGB65473.1 PTS sugar transporter subunit IIABC [Absiella sp. AM09-45]